MINWHVVFMEAEYKQRELQHEAENRRLAKMSKDTGQNKITLVCLLLDRLGQSLVEIGMGLRRKYGIPIQNRGVFQSPG